MKIRSLRESLGLTQEELGFRSKISAQHLGHIERGVKSCRIDTLLKIADGLGVKLDELFQFDYSILTKAEKSSDAISNKIIALVNSMSDSQRYDVLKIIKIFMHSDSDED